VFPVLLSSCYGRIAAFSPLHSFLTQSSLLFLPDSPMSPLSSSGRSYVFYLRNLFIFSLCAVPLCQAHRPYFTLQWLFDRAPLYFSLFLQVFPAFLANPIISMFPPLHRSLSVQVAFLVFPVLFPLFCSFVSLFRSSNQCVCFSLAEPLSAFRFPSAIVIC